MPTRRGPNMLLRVSLVVSVIALVVALAFVSRLWTAEELVSDSETPRLLEAHGVESTALYSARDTETPAERLYLRTLALTTRAQLTQLVNNAAARSRLIAANPLTIGALRACDRETTVRLANSLVADSTEIDLLALFNADGTLCGFNSHAANGVEYGAERVQQLYELSFANREVIQGCLDGARGSEQLEYQHQCDFARALLNNRERAVAYSSHVRDPATGAILGVASVRVWFDRFANLLPPQTAARVALVTDDGKLLGEAATTAPLSAKPSPLEIPAEVIAEMIAALRAKGALDATFVWRQMLVELADASVTEAVDGGGAYVLAYSDLAWITSDARQARTMQAFAALAGALLLVAGFATVFAVRVHRLSAEVDANRVAAESSSTAKSDFLAHMSHEIRTPMTAILGYLELLSRDESQRVNSPSNPPSAPAAKRATRAQMIEIASRNARFLLGIIDDLLDLSRIESKKFVPHYEWVRPTEIAQECVATLAHSAHLKGIGLRVDDSVTEPPEVCTDGARLKQVLMNLVNNAVKFTTYGQVIITARTIGVNDLEIRVQDTGCGIDKADRDLLFKPFSQVDSRANRTHTGTGLGLAICKRYVEALGGTIVLDSMVGRGTTAIVRLPSRPLLLSAVRERKGNTPESTPRPSNNQPAAAAATKPPSESSEQAASDTLASVRVLVVEDYDANQDLMRYFLESAGAVVTVAEDGVAAIDRIAQTDPPFDVVLMDMQMPVLDGYGATAKLRESGYTGVIIAMTAHAMVGEREKCLEAGCTDYLSKPMTLAQLVNKVKEHAPKPRHTA